MEAVIACGLARHQLVSGRQLFYFASLDFLEFGFVSLICGSSPFLND